MVKKWKWETSKNEEKERKHHGAGGKMMATNGQVTTDQRGS